jgi:hypothetical protein
VCARQVDRRMAHHDQGQDVDVRLRTALRPGAVSARL